MALTLAEAGKNNSATSTATLVVTSAVSFAAGDMVVVCIASDNAGSAGAVSISSVTDSKSHTYTQRAVQNRDPGAANAGATSAIYTAFVTSAMTTSDTITVNFSPNTTYKSAVVWKASVASTEFPKYLSNGGSTGNTANPSLASSSISSGDGVIYALAVESNATLTGDSDTSNGSWATLYTDIGTGGTAATSMRVGSQYKVVTGTATQTWNTTITAADWAITYIVLDPAAKIQRTADNTGTGTQSASGKRVAVRTASNTGTGTQTAVGRKVKQRTATGSGTGTQTADDQLFRVRTATATGTGTQTAARLIKRFRTSTGSGTGSQTAVNVVIKFRTATGSGVGAGSGDCDFIHTKTATGSGVGSGTATGQKFGSQTFQRTATGSGVGAGVADKDLLHIRTATGSGTGTATVVGQHRHPRSATGSGTGSSSVTWFYKRARNATGTGTGTSTTAFIRVPRRTANNTGLGTSTSDETLTAKRTASNTGNGTSTVLRRLVALRTATATGASTETGAGCKVFRKTATASGIGTQTVTSIKLLIFRPPNSTERKADRMADDFAFQLFRYAEPILAGVNIYKLTDGTYTQIEQRDPDLVSKIYYGGSVNFVTQQEKDDLIAAGYGSYVT